MLSVRTARPTTVMMTGSIQKLIQIQTRHFLRKTKPSLDSLVFYAYEVESPAILRDAVILCVQNFPVDLVTIGLDEGNNFVANFTKLLERQAV